MCKSSIIFTFFLHEYLDYFYALKTVTVLKKYLKYCTIRGIFLLMLKM